ncbi:hypothetical protein Tco_0226773 [Tanacetum coccineum]
MQKLKENVYAIQVGCEVCEGMHLNQDCPLNKGESIVEEVKYGEFGRSFPNNNGSGARYRVGPPRYYTREDNHQSFGEKKCSLEDTVIGNREKGKQLKEMLIKKENAENINDRSSGILPCQLPPKEMNPGSFTLPCTIGSLNVMNALEDLGGYGVYLSEYLRLNTPENNKGGNDNSDTQNIFLNPEYYVASSTRKSDKKSTEKEAKAHHCNPDVTFFGTSYNITPSRDSELEACLNNKGDKYELRMGRKGGPLQEIWDKCGEVSSLETLTRLNSSTRDTEGFKRLVAYAK